MVPTFSDRQISLTFPVPIFQFCNILSVFCLMNLTNANIYLRNTLQLKILRKNPVKFPHFSRILGKICSLWFCQFTVQIKFPRFYHLVKWEFKLESQSVLKYLWEKSRLCFKENTVSSV